jgi:hypothetical protein
MKYIRPSQFLFIFLCVSECLYAQAWSGILSPSRAIDWTSAGVVGGIPNRTTICSTLNPGATAAQINAAISSCPSGEVVYLNAGTYNISDGGIVMQNNVTLRGAGANQTLLVFTSDNSCNGAGAVVCFLGGPEYYGAASVQPGGTNAATWSGGYAQGATQITLTSIGSSGISVGQYINLDQADDTTDNGNFIICDQNTGSPPCSLEALAPGRTVGGAAYNQVQMVKVTNISGSTYTITPGLYAPNWASGKSPGAWWASSMLQNAGVENLSIDATNAPGNQNITFDNAANCWLKGIRAIGSTARDIVDFVPAVHCTVQDSYFYGSGGAETSYGIESFISSDNLVLNNIFQHIAVPMMMGPALGTVLAYNFSINDAYTGSTTWMADSTSGHDAGVEYLLLEGNIGAGYGADVFHGTQGFQTLFRNYLVGHDTGRTQATTAIQLFSYNRYHNIIGNVLGLTGYTTTYQASGGVGQSATVYDFGAGNNESGVTVPSDPLVASTSMRWGNYDVASAAARFVISEVPSGISHYGNAVPSSQTLPASFYYSSQPSWWPSGKAWPPIGPDVTGGNIQQCSGGTYAMSLATASTQCTGGSLASDVAGYANSNPAMDCYLIVMGGPPDGTGSALTFNANTCYGQPVAPSPPSSVTAVAH